MPLGSADFYLGNKTRSNDHYRFLSFYKNSQRLPNGGTNRGCWRNLLSTVGGGMLGWPPRLKKGIFTYSQPFPLVQMWPFCFTCRKGVSNSYMDHMGFKDVWHFYPDTLGNGSQCSNLTSMSVQPPTRRSSEVIFWESYDISLVDSDSASYYKKTSMPFHSYVFHCYVSWFKKTIKPELRNHQW